jgi:leucyl aminopeptidase
MTTTEITQASPTDAKADALALPIFEGKGGKPEAGPGVTQVSHALGVDLVAEATRHRLKGEIGDTLSLAVGADSGVASRTVVLTGIGPKSQAGRNEVRRAAHHAANQTRRLSSLASTLPQVGDDPAESARAFVEGAMLGAYAFTAYKSRPEHARALETFVLIGEGRKSARVSTAVERGRIAAEAANWVRDLANMPAADCTPEALAQHGRDIASAFDMGVKIWNEAELRKGNFGGIIAVGQGSALESRLIELEYRGGPASQKPIALTGKGITFDSGGLNIKKAKWMEHMKDDMCGAANALAVMRAAAEMGLRVNLIAAIPSAENMPSGSAIRQGDVIHHRNGKTSEMWHTDAEGRMLLTDALAYLAEKKPRAIIDSATLTSTGIGEDLWAVMGNDQKLIDDLRAAGDAAGDPGWQLPLWQPYKRHTESPVADMRNADWEGADTIAAALFLQEFVGDVPWAHLDCGDTAWLESEKDEWSEGPTGSPMRAMLRYVEDLGKRG